MKKTLVGMALLSSLCMAQEAHVGAGLGILAVPDGADAGIGLTLKGGVALDSVLQGMGLQVELNKSLIDPEYGPFDQDVTTLGAYTTYEIPLPNSQMALRPRFGVILPNLGDDVDSRDFILSSGFGAIYKVDAKMNLYVDYTVLGDSVNNYSAGLEIKF